MESSPIRPSASFSSRCRGVSAGRDVAPSGVFAALSPLALARLARNPGALGVCDARTMRAADCFVVRVSHELAVPVGHDRPPVASRNDVRAAAIWAAPLRVPLLKDPADDLIRLVQLAGAWAGSPPVGNLANIHLPIVVHNGDGAASVGPVLTGDRAGPAPQQAATRQQNSIACRISLTYQEFRGPSGGSSIPHPVGRGGMGRRWSKLLQQRLDARIHPLGRADFIL